MVKIALLVLVAVTVIVGANYFNLQQLLKAMLSWIDNLGQLGMIIFIVIYILAAILFLPGSMLTLGAGVLFGLAKGSIVVSIGSTLGATCAFLIGRYLARDLVGRQIADNKKFKAVDEAVAKEGWKIVLLTRLSPVLPFNLLNYTFGLTKVRLKHYFFASWLGMLPGTIMYVYIGSLAGDLAHLGRSGHTRSTTEWMLYAIGLLATVAVTIFITRLAKKALAIHGALGERKS